VKEVAAHDDEIDPFVDPVTLQNVDPSVEKIPRAFRQIVSGTSEMDVGNVQEPHLSSI
jgi:hypothetical protein